MSSTESYVRMTGNKFFFKCFRISEIVFIRSFDTVRRFDFIYQFTDMYRQEQKALNVLHGFTDDIIRTRRNELRSRSNNQKEESHNNDVGSKRKMALLDLLLEANVQGVQLSDTDIREEVDTFMFAGHDTTSTAISFFLYNVAKHPAIQAKLYEEIVDTLGADDRKLSLKDLNALHYLDLVIKESLRLHPVVPYFGRRLCEDVKMNGYTLPRFSNVFISPYVMGRNENIFPDPMTFNPDRFNVETTPQDRNSFAFVPFSAGPRNCIGGLF